jgi:3-hydroxymyristoyl/3-hydroxydecanoyl-(acyl carrier protein) dehydratase
VSLVRQPPFGRDEILEVLPHRPPFVLIDSVLEADRDHAVATLRLQPGDLWFQGHFPGEAVLPGALLVEAMAQTCFFVYAVHFERDELLYLTQVKTRFRSVVRPPAELRITATAVKMLKQACLMTARVAVGDRLVAEADLGLATPSFGTALG